jgi:hypothetical protein
MNSCHDLFFCGPRGLGMRVEGGARVDGQTCWRHFDNVEREGGQGMGVGRGVLAYAQGVREWRALTQILKSQCRSISTM